MMQSIYSESQSAVALPATKTAGGMRVVHKNTNTNGHDGTQTTLPNDKLGDTAPSLAIGDTKNYMASAKEHNKRIPELRKAQIPTVEKPTKFGPNVANRRSGNVMQLHPGF